MHKKFNKLVHFTKEYLRHNDIDDFYNFTFNADYSDYQTWGYNIPKPSIKEFHKKSGNFEDHSGEKTIYLRKIVKGTNSLELKDNITFRNTTRYNFIHTNFYVFAYAFIPKGGNFIDTVNVDKISFTDDAKLNIKIEFSIVARRKILPSSSCVVNIALTYLYNDNTTPISIFKSAISDHALSGVGSSTLSANDDIWSINDIPQDTINPMMDMPEQQVETLEETEVPKRATSTRSSLKKVSPSITQIKQMYEGVSQSPQSSQSQQSTSHDQSQTQSQPVKRDQKYYEVNEKTHKILNKSRDRLDKT